MSTPLFVGLDVGGTTMKAGTVDAAGQVLGTSVVPTEAERGQEHGLRQMERGIREAVAAAGLTLEQITVIGVATPGFMDIPAGLILDPPNLKPWRNVPVRQHIADVFGLPTAFQNDANAAALGEYWAGAGGRRPKHGLVHARHRRRRGHHPQRPRHRGGPQLRRRAGAHEDLIHRAASVWLWQTRLSGSIRQRHGRGQAGPRGSESAGVA